MVKSWQWQSKVSCYTRNFTNKQKESDLSPEKAIEIAKTIYQVIARLDNNQPVKHILILTNEQKYLSELFEYG